MSIVRSERQLETDREPWEKQPFESWKAFEAFREYRDAGPSRSLREVAQKTVERSPKRKQESVETQLSRWSSLNRWAERIEAWTLYMDQALVRSREAQVARINEEDLEVGDQLMRLVRNTTDLMDKVEAGIPLELVDRFLTTAVKTRRLAAGMATDHLKAGLSITTQDMARVLNKIVDVACEFIPPEQREEFIRRVTEEAG